MSEPSREILHQVVASTLEEAAYVFTEPLAEAAPWQAPVVQSVLEFSGEARGWLMLASSSEFGATLAANLLGLEPEDPTAAEKGQDAFGELLNIVAGSLLDAWFGAEADCCIGVPKVVCVPPERHLATCGEASLVISLMTDTDEQIDVVAFIEAR